MFALARGSRYTPSSCIRTSLRFYSAQQISQAASTPSYSSDSATPLNSADTTVTTATRSEKNRLVGLFFAEDGVPRVPRNLDKTLSSTELSLLPAQFANWRVGGDEKTISMIIDAFLELMVKGEVRLEPRVGSVVGVKTSHQTLDGSDTVRSVKSAALKSELEMFVDSLESYQVRFKGIYHAKRLFFDKTAKKSSQISTGCLIHILYLGMESMKTISTRQDQFRPFIKELNGRLRDAGENKFDILLMEKLCGPVFSLHGSPVFTGRALIDPEFSDFSSDLNELKGHFRRLFREALGLEKSATKPISHLKRINVLEQMKYFLAENNIGSAGQSADEGGGYADGGGGFTMAEVDMIIENLDCVAKTWADLDEVLFHTRGLTAVVRAKMVNTWLAKRIEKGICMDSSQITRWLEMMSGVSPSLAPQVEKMKQQLLERGWMRTAGVQPSVLAVLAIEQQSTTHLSKLLIPSLAPSDLLLIGRTPDKLFFKAFLKACEKCIESIRPLQLATLIGLRRNSHLHTTKTEVNKETGEEKIVISCPFELSLMKKVHTASARDAVLLKQLIVNLTHMGGDDCLVLATLRNKYLKLVLGGLG